MPKLRYVRTQAINGLISTERLVRLKVQKLGVEASGSRENGHSLVLWPQDAGIGESLLMWGVVAYRSRKKKRPEEENFRSRIKQEISASRSWLCGWGLN